MWEIWAFGDLEQDKALKNKTMVPASEPNFDSVLKSVEILFRSNPKYTHIVYREIEK